MNDAFDGAKDNDKAAGTTAGKAAEQQHSKKEKKPLALTAGGSALLDPILEEPSHPGYEVAVYKPNQSLADQRKAKNDELKRKVRMITAAERLETGSVASNDSMVSGNQGTFITRTKDAGKKKQRDSSSSSSDSMRKRPESPTTRAAQALALMNKKEDKDLAVVAFDSESIYARPEREVFEDQARLEDEMNAMFKELEEMEDMIKGN